jgi:hypothetical protein
MDINAAQPLRPAGIGPGLLGPACPERAQPQFPDHGDNYRVRICDRCGRVTARVDADGAGWCGGTLPVSPAAARRPTAVTA